MKSPTKSSLESLSKDALIAQLLAQNEALLAKEQRLSSQENQLHEQSHRLRSYQQKTQEQSHRLRSYQQKTQEQSHRLRSYQQKTQEQSSQLKQKNAFIEQLKEALILARNRQFAKLSESMRYLQLDLFNEAEETCALENDAQINAADEGDNDNITVPEHTRSKKGKGRKPLPEDLPRHDVIHDLADAEKVCAHDGSALMPMPDKVSEQLDIIPMQLRVIRHIRKQYVCRTCEAAGRSGCVHTANKPKQAIEKSQASSGLLAYLAVSKYADGLPLYRQSGILKRFDIDIERTTMANWMIKCGQLLQPVINRLEEQLLTQPVIHMDETPVQVLNEAGKPAQSTSYMWVRCAGPPDKRIILFDYDASRSGRVPERLLADYNGALMVDGYQGYESVCANQAIQRLGCLAHARRKFVDVVKSQKKGKKSPADKALRLIGNLYQLEKQLSLEEYQRHSHEQSYPDWRYAQRFDKAKPIWDELYQWSLEIKPKVPPKTTLGKAITYLHNQWERLTAYIKDGRYPIDNNAVENAIRPFAIGRKNWLFSNSVQGAKASANLYSLIETAKAHDIEPYSYLKHLFDALPNINNYDDVDTLLPEKFQERRL